MDCISSIFLIIMIAFSLYIHIYIYIYTHEGAGEEADRGPDGREGPQLPNKQAASKSINNIPPHGYN